MAIKKATTLTILLVMGAAATNCGRRDVIPPGYYQMFQAQSAYQQQLQPSQKEEECHHNLDESTEKTTSTTPTVSQPATKSTQSAQTSNAAAPSKPAATPTQNKPPTPTQASPDGQEILKKLMASVTQGDGYEALIIKDERVKSTGANTRSKIKLTSKKPNRTKLDLIVHYKPENNGVKMVYTIGASKVKIRPAGHLSFLTTDLDMLDKRVVTPNDYRPDQLDFYALAQRFADPGYEAKLVGKSTIGGQTVHIVKTTKSGTPNSLDPEITYEYIGYNPDTYEVKLWEAYTGDTQVPLMRVVIETFKTFASMPESMMKI